MKYGTNKIAQAASTPTARPTIQPKNKPNAAIAYHDHLFFTTLTVNAKDGQGLAADRGFLSAVITGLASQACRSPGKPASVLGYRLQDSPSGVSRIGGQAGAQAPTLRPHRHKTV
jgi:hypothetical protein